MAEIMMADIEASRNIDAVDAAYTNNGTIDYHGNPANKKETGSWRACYYILVNEGFERMAYFGMSSNLYIYFKNQLNQPTANASRNLSNWTGTCYMMPMLGAFLADAYLGGYWTITVFSIIYTLGMTLLALSASIPGLKPTCTENNKNICTSTKNQTAFAFMSLYLVALGSGAIKPCVSSYGGIQFDETDEVEKNHQSSFFNWFYFSINVGQLIACSVLVWIQLNIGWDWGFGIPAMIMAIAVVSFLLGTRTYRYLQPSGSPFTRLIQVVVASIRKFRVPLPADVSLLYDMNLDNVVSRKLVHTNGLSFFDKAAVQIQSDQVSMNPWKLCTVTQVEEFKIMLRLLPILGTSIIFNAAYGLMGNLFVSQGNLMDKSMGPKFQIPEASLIVFDTISCILWVPVYDRMIVPFIRKFTGHKDGWTCLQRIGIGLFMSIFSVMCASILESFRLREVRRHNLYGNEEGMVLISIFWQVPQYFIIGLAGCFVNIGSMQFLYDEAPDSLRSICSALGHASNALGNYLSSLLILIVTKITAQEGNHGWIADDLNKGHLDYFFWLLTALSIINLGVFVLVAKKYTHKNVMPSLP